MLNRSRLFCPSLKLIVVSMCCQPMLAANLNPPAHRADTRQTDIVRIPRSEIVTISTRIDELVDRHLDAHQLPSAPRSSDSVFLRRIYLDISGRIPTLAETTSFLASDDPQKRQQLIDKLLESEGYVSHYFNFWADILRIKSRIRRGTGQPYIDYVKQSLAENKPYDQFVRELLISEGPAMRRGNGATGYYLRDFGMPEDNMSNTVRVFLGTRLECAQCHDHPFDTWTQREYFQMVAFTGGVDTRLRTPDSVHARELMATYRDRSLSRETKRQLRRTAQPLAFGVAGSGTGLTRLPDDYQYGDGKPNEIVTAKTIFDQQELVDARIPRQARARKGRGNRAQMVKGARQIGSREAYADWLTSPENPRFTLVIANRLWKKATGRGLIEPVDDITDATEPLIPELMTFLKRQMQEFDYDMKQYLRAIFYSNAYQRLAFAADVAEEDFFFAGPRLRRMTGEQVWDSLLTLAVDDLDQRRATPRVYGRWLNGDDPYAAYEQLRQLTPDQLLAMARQRAPGMQQANSQKSSQRKRRVEQRQRIQAEIQALSRDIRKARRAQNYAEVANLVERRKKKIQQFRRGKRGGLNQLLRASELASPPRPGHFIRQFGASDREQIENSHRDPSATQALSLMNGFVETHLTRNTGTRLLRNLEQESSHAGQVDTVFLSVLNRFPTDDERQEWLDDMRQFGRTNETIQDLIWTLVNTSEFLFIR